MRRIARVQQRKRQSWLALPASGIEEVSHGSPTERSIGKDCGEAKDSRRGRNPAALPARHTPSPC